MSAVADLTIRLLPGKGTRSLTRDEAASVEDILDAATEWQAGRLPLGELARIGSLAYGTRPSPGYSRFVAVYTTSRRDPRRAALQAAIEEMVRREGWVSTGQGLDQQGQVHVSHVEPPWARGAA